MLKYLIKQSITVGGVIRYYNNSYTQNNTLKNKSFNTRKYKQSYFLKFTIANILMLNLKIKSNLGICLFIEACVIKNMLNKNNVISIAVATPK